ncbi:MAG: hypothetical protein ACOYY2_04290 [Actinomycetota bacterium]
MAGVAWEGGGGAVLLGIYLNDHLAGATAGVELARRAASARRRSPAGPPLERLAAEIAEDRAALVAIMQDLRVPIRHYKVYAGWVTEKLGRFKLNGQVVGRSPLSDLVELEALRLGVAGKAAGWQALRDLAAEDPRLDQGQLDGLLDRARAQADLLEGLRRDAVRRAFGAGAPQG